MNEMKQIACEHVKFGTFGYEGYRLSDGTILLLCSDCKARLVGIILEDLIKQSIKNYLTDTLGKVKV